MRLILLNSSRLLAGLRTLTGAGLGFDIQPAPTLSGAQLVLNRVCRSDSDFVLADMPPPPGSKAVYGMAVEYTDLVLVPTGTSPLDMKRTQVTVKAIEDSDVPIVVVLVNVDKREKLLDKA